jgi:hypothetical protein
MQDWAGRTGNGNNVFCRHQPIVNLQDLVELLPRFVNLEQLDNPRLFSCRLNQPARFIHQGFARSSFSSHSYLFVSCQLKFNAFCPQKTSQMFNDKTVVQKNTRIAKNRQDF